MLAMRRRANQTYVGPADAWDFDEDVSPGALGQPSVSSFSDAELMQ